MIQLLLLLLLLLSRFSRVRLCATPQTAAHQAPLSLWFSRQEYWSGLPIPTPMHACMLSRFSCIQLCATARTAAHQAPLSTGFSSRNTGVGCQFLLLLGPLVPTNTFTASGLDLDLIPSWRTMILQAVRGSKSIKSYQYDPFIIQSNQSELIPSINQVNPGNATAQLV